MFLQLLGVGLAASITENIVFSRGLMLGFQKNGGRDFGEKMYTGLLITLFTMIASVCGWIGAYLSENFFDLLLWTRPTMFLVVYAVVMVATMLGYYEYTATFTGKVRQMSSMLVYSLIPMGTLFIVGNASFTFVESLVYGIGAGVGYMMALAINHCLQKRMAHSDIPVVFCGMPATLLSFAMISLALFGLLGHQLAV